MHELGIAQAALQETLERARDAGGERVARIVLQVGEFSGVDPDALRFAFTAISPGTAAEGAVLEINTVAALARCPDCGREFSPGDDFMLVCPACHRPGATLSRGRELELTRLEIN